jgi:hypothetical protein
MVCVNQTRPHCVNQMGKKQSKSLSKTAWQGNGTGTAWEQHGKCESAFSYTARNAHVTYCQRSPVRLYHILFTLLYVSARFSDKNLLNIKRVF